MCTGLALTACGGALTPEEAAAEETAALATSEAALASCGTWSSWTNTGATSCEPRSTCGSEWRCEPNLKGGDAQSLTGGPEGLIPVCPPGESAVRYDKNGRFNQQSSYRVCFDAAGNYTHTEYQYQSVFSACGC
ncbi:hypothetical protein D7W81_27650 [Corallococcus aberystwythensis]|uniref:Uncharacterized protein n=1 Tax=Corallococcus aberystwythensis TaxID=2316722 RepID=A0A3A8PW20_9BACT|nr:hypothetical protein D7W81_27650 [Corallococcus aberystwythensis]